MCWHKLTSFSNLNSINVLSNTYLMLFTTATFAIHSTGLMKLHQQVIQRWRRSVSVYRKTVDKLLKISLHNLLLHAKSWELIISFITLSSLLKPMFIIVYTTVTCQWQQRQTPVKRCSYWYLKNNTSSLTVLRLSDIQTYRLSTFKPNSVYYFQINCKILDTNLH